MSVIALGAFTPVLVLVLTLFSLSGVAGGILGYFKSKYSEQQLIILRETNDAQDNRIKFLEGENTRIKAELKIEHDARLALEEIVTGKKLLESILDKLVLHDKKVEQDVIAIMKKDTDIIQLLTTMANKLGGDSNVRLS